MLQLVDWLCIDEDTSIESNAIRYRDVPATAASSTDAIPIAATTAPTLVRPLIRSSDEFQLLDDVARQATLFDDSMQSFLHQARKMQRRSYHQQIHAAAAFEGSFDVPFTTPSSAAPLLPADLISIFTSLTSSLASLTQRSLPALASSIRLNQLLSRELRAEGCDSIADAKEKVAAAEQILKEKIEALMQGELKIDGKKIRNAYHHANQQQLQQEQQNTMVGSSSIPQSLPTSTNVAPTINQLASTVNGSANQIVKASDRAALVTAPAISSHDATSSLSLVPAAATITPVKSQTSHHTSPAGNSLHSAGDVSAVSATPSQHALMLVREMLPSDSTSLEHVDNESVTPMKKARLLAQTQQTAPSPAVAVVQALDADASMHDAAAGEIPVSGSSSSNESSIQLAQPNPSSADDRNGAEMMTDETPQKQHQHQQNPSHRVLSPTLSATSSPVDSPSRSRKRVRYNTTKPASTTAASPITAAAASASPAVGGLVTLLDLPTPSTARTLAFTTSRTVETPSGPMHALTRREIVCVCTPDATMTACGAHVCKHRSPPERIDKISEEGDQSMDTSSSSSQSGMSELKLRLSQSATTSSSSHQHQSIGSLDFPSLPSQPHEPPHQVSLSLRSLSQGASHVTDEQDQPQPEPQPQPESLLQPSVTMSTPAPPPQPTAPVASSFTLRAPPSPLSPNSNESRHRTSESLPFPLSAPTPSRHRPAATSPMIARTSSTVTTNQHANVDAMGWKKKRKATEQEVEKLETTNEA